ncbi:MAG TPA: MetQ/NlpA family ABC transporter substrate-binding protein [Geomonas sp.]|nr:MetQ/NlpA family ABC transporter substrate-binding protein [Geomonas sp.]
MRFRVAIKLLLLVALVVMAACKQAGNEKGTAGNGGGVPLRVGAALVPHAEILNFIKPQLKKEGVNLEVVVLDEEGWMNPALAEKQIDANYFQHVPYLNSVCKEKGYAFAVAAKVHVEPMGFYSQRIKSLDQLKEGATIAIPNNPSNEYRALALLEKKGLVKLKPGIKDFSATPRDIVENPRKLKFAEVESAQLVRSLADVDGAVINTNYVLDAKLDPGTALFREEADSPYANVIVVRKGEENRPEIRKLVAAATSPEVKKFLQQKYGNAVVPAF